jgi:putative transposase
MGHPPRVPVLLGLDQSVIYFVTFCVEGRRHVLDNDDAFAAFRQAIARLEWHIIAAVVMPDHVHLLAGPRHRDAAVGSLSAAIKRAIRKRLDAAWTWQPGCFDRLLRREESAEEKWEYIRENPVRAGYLRQAGMLALQFESDSVGPIGPVRNQSQIRQAGALALQVKEWAAANVWFPARPIRDIILRFAPATC